MSSAFRQGRGLWLVVRHLAAAGAVQFGAHTRYNAWFNCAGRRHMSVTYLPLVNDNNHRIDDVAVRARDITDIKEAEEKLQLAASVIENTRKG